MNEYPKIYPMPAITASLLAGGFQFDEALKRQADPEFEAIDDEHAIELAIRLGWNGDLCLDRLIDSWLGRKWAVMTVIARHLTLTAQQADELLLRLNHRGIAGEANFAHAMMNVRLAPGNVGKQIDIRNEAQRLLNERKRFEMESDGAAI